MGKFEGFVFSIIIILHVYIVSMKSVECIRDMYTQLNHTICGCAWCESSSIDLLSEFTNDQLKVFRKMSLIVIFILTSEIK